MYDLAIREFSDGVPRVNSLDVARKLGYRRPRKINELIREIWQGHKYKQVQRIKGGSPLLGAHLVEHWLTKEQAIRVVMRARTPNAEKLQEGIAAVFVAWQEGRLAPAPTRALPALTRALPPAVRRPEMPQVTYIDHGRRAAPEMITTTRRPQLMVDVMEAR